MPAPVKSTHSPMSPPIPHILTMHNEHDTFADCWRDAIGGNAEIGAHIQAIHFANGQKRAIVCDGCKSRETVRERERGRNISRLIMLLIKFVEQTIAAHTHSHSHSQLYAAACRYSISTIF